MASITDIILQQVTKATSSVQLPTDTKQTVVNGLSNSILGSLTQTVSSPGGVDLVKELITGKTAAAASPITSLATKIFSGNILSKLNLGNSTNNALTSLIPTILTSVSGIFKDRDGDGDVDLNDIILSFKGGSTGGSSILGAATSILGGLFKK